MVADTAKAVVDTLKEASGGAGWMMHHILDGRELDLEPFGTIHFPEWHLFGVDISITKHVVFLWLAFLIVFLVFKSVSNSYKKSLVPRGFANFLEVLIVFVRDDIAKVTIGEKYKKYVPYLLTVFFFILTCNLLGLVPYGNTATSNINVTATLAVFSFFLIQAGGMKKYGVFGYFKAMLPHGVPVVFLPVLFVVEFIGLFTKPFALAVRLFANMIAGHTVIFSLIGLIFILHSYFVAPVSVAFALFIELLEILVAFIQAYIFTILTALFVGMAMHLEH
jgi:F-type H+-transporting ATPase subunit a